LDLQRKGEGSGISGNLRSRGGAQAGSSRECLTGRCGGLTLSAPSSAPIGAANPNCTKELWPATAAGNRAASVNLLRLEARLNETVPFDAGREHEQAAVRAPGQQRNDRPGWRLRRRRAARSQLWRRRRWGERRRRCSHRDSPDSPGTLHRCGFVTLTCATISPC
jgi:hypothetical protein